MLPSDLIALAQKHLLQSPVSLAYSKSRKFGSAFFTQTQVGYLDSNFIFSLDPFYRQAYSLTYNNPTKGETPLYFNHLVFPTYSVDGKFSSFIGRILDPEASLKYQLPKHLLFSKEFYIHNQAFLKPSTEPVFVTENTVEWGRVLEASFTRACSLTGAYKHKHKLLSLALQFPNLRFIIDNDKAGRELKDFINELYTPYPNIIYKFVEFPTKGLDEYYLAEGLAATKTLLSNHL